MNALSEVKDLLKCIGRKFGLYNIKNDILALTRAIYNKLNEVPYIPYAVSLSTVDIFAIYFDPDDNRYYVILGRKPGQTKFQFIGGFRDPGEISAQAAAREFWEEAMNGWERPLPHELFSFIQEMAIDDTRYRNSCHKITTSIYLLRLTKWTVDGLKPGDDIEELKTFSIYDLLETFGTQDNPVRDVHQGLLKILLDTLTE